MNGLRISEMSNSVTVPVELETDRKLKNMFLNRGWAFWHLVDCSDDLRRVTPVEL